MMSSQLKLSLFLAIVCKTWRLLRLLGKLYLIRPIKSLYRRIFSPTSVHGYDCALDRHLSIDILHHDANYLIINKPYDININTRSPRVDESKRPAVDSILRAAFPAYELKNLHQIDYATSGIFCYGLHKKAAADGSLMFKRRMAQKEYLAIVRGHLEFEERYIDAPIADDPTELLKRSVNGLNSTTAETICKVLKKGYLGSVECTLVSLKPITGRRHQLRVHMNYIGHPIIGDFMYEDPATPTFRMMLHAHKIYLPIHNLRPQSKYWGKSGRNTRNPKAGFASRLIGHLGVIHGRLASSATDDCPVEAVAPCEFDALVSLTPGIEYELADDVKKYQETRLSRHVWVTANVKPKRQIV